MVFGLVIQHQDFEVRVVLIQQRLQAGADVIRFVPGRDQHRDHRPFRGGRELAEAAHRQPVAEADDHQQQQEGKHQR